MWAPGPADLIARRGVRMEGVDSRQGWVTALRRHPRVILARNMWRSAPLACVVLLVLIASAAVLSLLFVFTLAALVSSVPAAVRAGAGSDEADRTYRLVAGVAAIFAGQQVAATVQPVLGAMVGRRVDAALTERVLVAAGAPETMEHLDDPEMAARIRAASSVGTAYIGPGLAAEGLTLVLRTQLNGLAMLAVVASYQVWMAIVLAVAWFVARREAVKEAEQGGRLFGNTTAASQRAMYFRETALRPEAAKEIRVFGLSAWVTGSFRTLWSGIFDSVAAEKRDVRRPLFRRWMILFASQAVCLVAILGDAVDGDLSLRRFLLLVQAFLALSALCNVQVDEVWVVNGAATIPALEEIERELRPVASSRRAAPPLREAVVFERVTYQYPRQPTPTLLDFDLVVPVGRSLALVGANGAGKTTLIKLLTGLAHPGSGRVLVDGVDLRTLDPDSWRRQFGVVFQDFVHYDLAASDNVRYGAVDHAGSHDDLSRVAARAGIDQVIEQLPSGWDTVLSRQAPGGADLSGGEWQRLALARALWAVEGGAGFLVLDEPTAALDVRAEATFYDQFLDLTRGLTTVVVSHRFSTVRRADRIVVIDGGSLTEDGTHDELVALGGTYARMYEAQSAEIPAKASEGGAARA